MARYNGLIIPRSYNDYFSRSDPQAIRDIVALAADGELNAESKNPLQNQAIAKIVPATASPENKLIVQSQISGLTADVETIKNIIPNTASETNELADKNFVNSTVGTNTANYIYKTETGGEKVPFSSVAELEAYAGTVTNNDYAFVTGIDENGNAYYDRYKADVNDGVVTWAKEYRLNNSSFTAEQWAAIQSGITAEKVAQFEAAVAPVDAVQSGNMSAVTSNAVANKVNGGVCISPIENAGKLVSIGNFVLKDGVIVTVMFTNGNSADNPTLNVNGTGAKPIKVVKAGAKVVPVTHTGYWRGSTTASVEMWQPYTILEFMYDGTDWVIVGNPTVESYSSDTASYEVKADGLIEYGKKYSNLESFSIGASEVICPYEGYIIVAGVASGQNATGYLIVNGIQTVQVYRDSPCSATMHVNKGDTVRLSATWINVKGAIWNKSTGIIN